jgi:hypothetical protein
MISIQHMSIGDKDTSKIALYRFNLEVFTDKEFEVLSEPYNDGA